MLRFELIAAYRQLVNRTSRSSGLLCRQAYCLKAKRSVTIQKARVQIGMLGRTKARRSRVKPKPAMLFVFLLCLFGIGAPVFAHHGGASYQVGKIITVKGTVTDYVWANPHVFLKVDAKDDKGSTTHWLVEAWNPVTQIGAGWTRNTFKPGDEVAIECTPAKNGSPVAQFAGRILINGKQTLTRFH